MTLEAATQISAFLCAVTAIISAAEYAVMPGLTRRSGLLDSRVHAAGILRIPGGFRTVVVLSGASGAAMALCAVNGMLVGMAVASLCLFGLSVGLGLSLPCGRDGADEMCLVTSAGIAIMASGLAGIGIGATRIGAVFLTAILCIAYFASGAAKVAGSTWRSGSALALIMGTRSYGTTRVATLLHRYPLLSRLGGYVMIAGELAFPFALVLPLPLSFGLLITGAGFHLFTAVLVRLNRFVTAFLSSYPPMVWVLLHRSW